MTVENSQDMLKEFDLRGLSPVAFAAFQAALASDSLLPLLSLLEPPKGETSKIDVLIEAVEMVLDSQKRIESRLAAIELKLAGSR
jgi:hypothetical protein